MPRRLAPVEGSKNLLKDLDTGAVINVDEKMYQHHVKKKQILEQRAKEKKEEKMRLNSFDERISSLEKNINKILDILEGGSDNADSNKKDKQ